MKSVFEKIKRWFFQDKEKIKRSPKWLAVKAKHLREFPFCEACGARKNVEVHHIVPITIRPDLELDPFNLWSLCRLCHLALGHLGNWQRYNPEIKIDSIRYKLQVERADARLKETVWIGKL